MIEHPPFDHVELHLGMTKAESGELLKLLNKALNTTLPHEWPTWVDPLLKRLEQFTGFPEVPR